MVNQDDNIAEQVIERHAEGKGVREIVRTLKKAPSTISRIVSQNSVRGVPETSTEQQTENTETAEIEYREFPWLKNHVPNRCFNNGLNDSQSIMGSIYSSLSMDLMELYASWRP